jgi:DNA-binding response OmpR family regulator
MLPSMAERTTQLLVVEDETPIREGLVALFEAQGFAVRSTADGLAALELLASHAFDLVLLDLMIPGLPGLDVLARLRALGHAVPVLVLTARGAEEDVVAGLERGADDYVVNPFGIHELVARAKGLLRRSARETSARVVAIGAAKLDLDGLKVTWPGGELALTAREASLLDYLLARKHRAVTREELLVDVWGYQDGTIQTRTIDVHVQQLRKRLRAVPGGEAWIGTVRGRGYKFEGGDA